jgi:hypothetical protein
MPFSIFAFCHSSKQFHFLEKSLSLFVFAKKIGENTENFWKTAILCAFALVLHLFCDNFHENNIFAKTKISV